MRYKPEHKKKTRARIVVAAGKLFRRQGYRGVGIDGIMAAAKLTRGGFYSYFRSKAELFAEVIRSEHGFNAMMKRRDGTITEVLATQALEIVDGYLHPDNRNEIGQGCSFASLSIDVAHAGKPAKDAYNAKLRDLTVEFARGLDNAGDLDPRALRAIALCVGGVILSRGCNDDELVAKLSEACRTAVIKELT